MALVKCPECGRDTLQEYIDQYGTCSVCAGHRQNQYGKQSKRDQWIQQETYKIRNDW